VLLLRTEDSECTLLELLELNPQATQREIASEMGVSLGKVNYCVQALVAKGLVKATNFKNSQRKAAYVYLLTPKGITAKAAISLRYLQRKVQEYEAITAEIDELESDLLAQGLDVS
jgi:EPS-associated MarR family transcriptional regulator